MYWERKRVRIQCLDFGEDITTRLLVVHRQTQNGMDAGGRNQLETPPSQTPRWRVSDVLNVISNLSRNTGMPS